MCLERDASRQRLRDGNRGRAGQRARLCREPTRAGGGSEGENGSPGDGGLVDKTASGKLS